MTSTDLGAAATASWSLGVNGATVVLTVTKPDGSTLTPAVTEQSGTYTASIPTTLPGRHLLNWSKAAAPAAAYTDVLNVWPADPRFLLSLDDVRRLCGNKGGSTSDDNELRLFSAATTIVIEDIVGAVLVRTITQKADGGKTGVALFERIKAGSSIAVTVNGVAQVQDVDFTVDATASIVYAGAADSPTWFAAGRQNVSITYTTGSATIDPNIVLAAGELVTHLWQVGHASTHTSWADDVTDTVDTPMGFAVPRRVVQLCGATHRLPGIG